MVDKVTKLLSKDDLKIDTTSVMVVEIENFTFEVDERFPWVNVYKRTDHAWQNREYITEINEEDTPIFVECEEGYRQLIEYCTNWLLKNRGLVKDVVIKGGIDYGRYITNSKGSNSKVETIRKGDKKLYR